MQAATLALMKLQKIVSLQYHVVEFEKTEGLVCLQAATHRFDLDHAIDREVSAVVAQEIEPRDLFEPRPVIDEGDARGRRRGLVFQQFYEEGLQCLCVVCDVFCFQHAALTVLS